MASAPPCSSTMALLPSLSSTLTISLSSLAHSALDPERRKTIQGSRAEFCCDAFKDDSTLVLCNNIHAVAASGWYVRACTTAAKTITPRTPAAHLEEARNFHRRFANTCRANGFCTGREDDRCPAEARLTGLGVVGLRTCSASYWRRRSALLRIA